MTRSTSPGTISRRTLEKTTRTSLSEEARRRMEREAAIPELYRRPLGDRHLQGCLKARA